MIRFRSIITRMVVLHVVAIGVTSILMPLALYRRSLRLGDASGVVAATLVLVGGFLLRVVIILSSEGV